MIVILPAALTLLGLMLGISAYGRLRSWQYPHIGLVVFFGATLILTPLKILDKVLLDSPKVILEATFYEESGFNLFLREDGTVKITEIDMFSSLDKYGTYQLLGDKIILKDININYGLSEVQDTLIISGAGLDFRLDNEWRGILVGQMCLKKNRLN